jgi:hypothetical protein
LGYLQAKLDLAHDSATEDAKNSTKMNFILYRVVKPNQALKAAKTIDAIAEEAVEMLLPSDYRKIAEARTSQRTAGNMGFN